MTNIEHEKKKPVAAVIVTAIISVIILTGAFQVFWYGPIKEKRIEAEKQLNEKDSIILDLRTLLKKEISEFIKFKSDVTKKFLEKGERIKALEKKEHQLSTSIDKIATRWNSFQGNICDSRIIPETIDWMKKAKANKK
jgi:hypothetical protein